jgi:hypothetical protein
MRKVISSGQFDRRFANPVLTTRNGRLWILTLGHVPQIARRLLYLLGWRGSENSDYAYLESQRFPMLLTEAQRSQATIRNLENTLRPFEY